MLAAPAANSSEKIMATPKKKHLIELMIEAGVKWPKGAEYAAQDKKDNMVHFYKDAAPKLSSGWIEWMANEGAFIGREHGVLLPSLCRNWHQTIVTREQYDEALAAVTPCAQHEERESEDIPAVDAVEWHNPQSIEQLTADYHDKAAEADRLQAVADEALKAADDALLALKKAGELIGLVISIDTKPKQVEQSNITDWRDLLVGDVIGFDGVDGEWSILDLEEEYDKAPIKVSEDINAECVVEGWVNILVHPWRFIRRP